MQDRKPLLPEEARPSKPPVPNYQFDISDMNLDFNNVKIMQANTRKQMNEDTTVPVAFTCMHCFIEPAAQKNYWA